MIDNDINFYVTIMGIITIIIVSFCLKLSNYIYISRKKNNTVDLLNKDISYEKFTMLFQTNRLG